MFAMTDCAGRWATRMASMAVASLLLVSVGATAADAETRTLRFYNVHTKERTEVAYKRNGRYLADGLKKINWALRDWRKSEPTNMDRQLLDLIWEAYRQSGSREYIHVISSYRSPATNNMLRSRSSGVAKSSQHTLGKALDFYLPDVPLRKMREIGLKMQVGGVGYYPKSGSPFVHFDVGNARHWPRMSRKELAAVFPNGGTVHIPSDGKPLPGYQQALASYKQRRSSADIQVANASSGGGGRSFFAALFGGGADEEEDNVVASAPAPAPRATVPARAAPAPREVAVASVIPSSRPALPTGVALPVRDDFDTSAPTPAAGLPQETEVAALEIARVPVPTWAARQAPMPAAEPSGQTESTLVAALEAQAVAESSAAVPGQLAYAVPTPQDRPPFAAVLKEPVAPESTAPTAQSVDAIKEIVVAATVPDSRPAPATTAVPVPAAQPAAAPAAPAADPARQMVAAVMPAPAAAMQEIEATATTATAPAPSGKSGRVTGSDVADKRKPVTIDPQEAISSRIEMAAIITDPDLPSGMGSMAKPNAERLVSDVPNAVFAMGFAPGTAAASSDHFVGSAVKFLPIAKFD